MAESDSLFSTEERRTLSAVLDRLIPADDVPGAVASGGLEYVEYIFRKELAPELALFREALRALDDAAVGRGHAGGFAALPPREQDDWLTSMERGRLNAVAPLLTPTFFERLLNLAAEGFYADPDQGGNHGAVSWKMMGYDPRIPGRTTVEWASRRMKTQP
ncbi:MAG TPA: gluconate 2-dehydrogenase subunit 3 family protein [Opitutaceae bacterium]